jgi:hypothetical protein
MLLTKWDVARRSETSLRTGSHAEAERPFAALTVTDYPILPEFMRDNTLPPDKRVPNKE